MAEDVERWFHVTRPERVEKILREGLKLGSERNLTDAGEWADRVYGNRPVYLAREPWISGGVVFEVDASGFAVTADLPSLVSDAHAYLDETSGEVELWWEEGEEPDELLPYLFSGSIAAQLLVQDPELAQAAISVTGTAACLQSIPPERLRILASN